ncbi:ankyrin repeat-containing domain protein [Xylaria scruposa]|nr:ankyrin repeat-containing domain protein [Xylaria scruposa]
MDPFSVSLGVITIFGAAKTVCNGLVLLKDAPREIEELRDALEHLTAVLNQVAVTAKTSGEPESPNDLLQLALDEASRVAEPLHSFLRELTGSDGTSPLTGSFDRIVWLRKRRVIKDFIMRLVNVKVSFIFALQAEQIFSSSRIETKLESVTETYATIDSLKSHLYPADGDENPGLGLQTSVVETTQGSQEGNTAVFDFRNVDFLLKCFGFEQNVNGVISSDRCNCDCHLDSSWESPRYLVSIFGRIHIVRRPSAPCYQSTCRKSCAATSVTTSLFWNTPAWWPTQRMISITYFSSPHLNPYISLSFPKIVASDAMIFHFATTGNVSGIQELLEDGAASPDDIKCDGGFTPLHYAIQANSLNACKFLIKARGRADLQTSASMTALDMAIAKVLTRAAKEETLIGLAELFKIPDGIENQRFTRVHEAVLGLKGESLTQALQQDIASLDKPDTNGRTPISWAAARGDGEAVSILMDHLADARIADVSGMTPLHYAATSNSMACLKLLLDSGADPSMKDKDRGWTPLHYASFHQANPSWVEEMLHHGADVNVKTDNLKSPLVLAIMKCHHLTARSLIKHGANIAAKGMDGFTPLNSTIISNSSACMQVLIDANINLDEIAWKGQTMLHLIALYATEEMIDCLIKADLSCLDLNACDESGQTALMLLKARTPSAPVFRAFAQLCAKITDDTDRAFQDLPA